MPSGVKTYIPCKTLEFLKSFIVTLHAFIKAGQNFSMDSEFAKKCTEKTISLPDLLIIYINIQSNKLLLSMVACGNEFLKLSSRKVV